nr:hypothetical protein [Candidatus Dojkabacteria bacterium]
MPYRLFTKKVKDVAGKEEQLRKILEGVTPDNIVEKIREVQSIIRWKDKEGEVQPNFFYGKDGKLKAKWDGFWQEFDSPTQLFDAYDMSDRVLQVDETNLNSRNFNDNLIKQGYFEATLNPGLFHSPA